MTKDIINKKCNNKELTFDELDTIVNGYLKSKINDEDMTLFLHAICDNGMSEQETIDLTEIFINSGDKIDLSALEGPIIDKHSTGGVGDKTTLILAPLVASCGVKVAKMSGRGLGHTGGTIDKLESIEGFNVNLSKEEFIKQIEAIDVALVSQTSNLVPADKKIYALRDVTNTVSSIPLIASSIMSKKIASGADKIVIDLKIGKGALVKDLKEAHELAKIMIKIGKHYQKEVVCIVSNMNAPLGRAIGNSVEVMESIKVLRGKGPADVRELVIVLGSYMVSLGKGISLDEAELEITTNLDNKLAYRRFEDLVKWQHGDLHKIPMADNIISIKSPKAGFVNQIDALALGELARELGAGRLKKDDVIDHSVGFVLSKQVGDFVLENEELLIVYLNKKDINIKALLDCFEIENDFTNHEPLIYEVIR